MDLQSYWSAVRRFWWVILLGLVLGGLAGGAVAVLGSPSYASTVTFFATTPESESTNALEGNEFGQQRVNSYVQLLSSQRLADQVISRTGVSLSAKHVMKHIEGSADLNTVLLTATVDDSSPSRSLALARAVEDDFPGLVEDIESQGGAQSAPVKLEVVSGPSSTVMQVGPRTKLDIASGVLVGLFLGALAAFVLATRNTAFHGTRRLREESQRPVLGVIPVARRKRSRALISQLPESSRAEAFRQLRTNVLHLGVDRPVQVLAVVSARPDDGRTSTAVNLALAFAETRRRVLLVDADLRSPQIGTVLGLDGARGLADLLREEASLPEVVRAAGPSGLQVLTGGTPGSNVAELLARDLIGRVLDAARGSFDLLVVDTPALLDYADATITAACTDGALVVVRRGQTSPTDFDETVEALSRVDVPVLGSVLNAGSAKTRDQ